MKFFAAIILSFFASSPLYAKITLTDSPAVYALTKALTLQNDGHQILLAIDKDQDLHHFALKPSQAGNLENAGLLITVGDSLTPSLSASYQKLNLEGKIIAIDQLIPLDGDPHFWVSPSFMINIAKKLDEKLTPNDPSRELGHALETELEAADVMLKETKFTHGVIVGHNAFARLIADYHIPYFGALTDIHDEPASPKDRQLIEEAINNGDVTCLISDENEVNPELEDFANEHEIGFIYVDAHGWKYADPQNAPKFFSAYYEDLARAFSKCE